MKKNRYYLEMETREINTLIKVVMYHREKTAKELRKCYGDDGKQNPDILGEESMYEATALDYVDIDKVLDKLNEYHHWFTRQMIITIKESINSYVVDVLSQIPMEDRDKETDIIFETIYLDHLNERCLKILDESSPFGSKQGSPTVDEVREFFKKN